MQGNFADQTLFTPAKPVAVQSLQTEPNDTLQDLELDHSDLNLTDDLLASPEKSQDDIDSVEKVELKTDEEADLETPSKEEVSFENIPVIERSESPEAIIAQQEIIPEDIPEDIQKVQETIPSESPETLSRVLSIRSSATFLISDSVISFLTLSVSVITFSSIISSSGSGVDSTGESFSTSSIFGSG
jgi:hypothetical protein